MLTDGQTWKAFRTGVKGSKWHVLRGYHAFRHSFASNLAAAGHATSAPRGSRPGTDSFAPATATVLHSARRGNGEHRRPSSCTAPRPTPWMRS